LVEDSSQNTNNINNNFIKKEESFTSRVSTQIFQIGYNQNEELNKSYDESNISTKLEYNSSDEEFNNLTDGEYNKKFIHFEEEKEYFF
jgi:hypothetical protein